MAFTASAFTLVLPQLTKVYHKALCLDTLLMYAQQQTQLGTKLSAEVAQCDVKALKGLYPPQTTAATKQSHDCGN